MNFYITFNIRVLYIIISISLFIILLQGCYGLDNDIKRAVRNQLQHYPESTLQDIYKSFFQDEFGPGHLVENVSYAREYFDLELEEMESQGRYNAEPCGTGKNFFRVPLDLVKDEKISDEDYFASFMESSSDFKIPDITVWKKKWGQIEDEIEKMNLQITGLESDKKIISEMLDRGEVVMHHSQGYVEAYDPHYRIMGKKQWERLKDSLAY